MAGFSTEWRVASSLCANMTETLASLFITVEGQEGDDAVGADRIANAGARDTAPLRSEVQGFLGAA